MTEYRSTVVGSYPRNIPVEDTLKKATISDDAALEMILALGLGAAPVVRTLRRLADRVGAMLTALIRAQRCRADERTG